MFGTLYRSRKNYYWYSYNRKNLEQSENLNKWIPIGSEIYPHHSFKQVVNQIEETTLSGYDNQGYPLSELLVEHPLTPFQIVIGMEGLHNKDLIEEYAENNLAVWIRRKWNEIHNEFEFEISFKSHSFSSLQQFANSYLYILKQVLKKSEFGSERYLYYCRKRKRVVRGME